MDQTIVVVVVEGTAYVFATAAAAGEFAPTAVQEEFEVRTTNRFDEEA